MKGESGEIAEEEGEGEGNDGKAGEEKTIRKQGHCFLHCLHSCTLQKTIWKALDLCLGQETGSLTERFFGGFSQSLQANPEMVPLLCQNHVLPNPFQFISYHTIQRYAA
jgi:hypothetical protein